MNLVLKMKAGIESLPVRFDPQSLEGLLKRQRRSGDIVIANGTIR